MMVLFPAIDLLNGKAVRLYQGDFDRREVYGEPLEFALDFQRQGATHLHLVDLDGAKAGKPVNGAIVKAICESTGLFVELGGGIRTEETLQSYLDMGVGRVILGTAALKDPSFTCEMLERHGEKIAIGVDARGGKVSIAGWLEDSGVDSYDFCQKMFRHGAKYVVYTDISRDGAQRGPNFGAYRRLTEIGGLRIIASGGVSSQGDVDELEKIGVYGAIIGKALYTGGIDLGGVLAQRARPK